MDRSCKIVTFVMAVILSLGILWAGAEAYAQSQLSDIDALIEAAGAGDLTTVRASIDSGIPVNAKDSLGVTALMEASYAGRFPVVKFLLDRGADANAKDEAGTSPLLEALGKDHADVALALIKAGADPNQRDGEDRTVLLRAVELARLDLLNAAIKAGVDIDSKSKQLNGKDGQRLAFNVAPLRAAILLDNIDAARALIGAGAELHPQPPGMNKSWTLLSTAAYTKSRKMIELLLKEGVQPNARLLAYAAEADFKLLRRLLKNRALRSPEPLRHALYHAVEIKNLKAAGELIKNGADPNREPDDPFIRSQFPPLVVAVRNGDLKMARLLVRAGADPNPDSGYVPIAWAASAGRADLVKLLADAGADMKRAVDDIITPEDYNQWDGWFGGPEWAAQLRLLVRVGAPVDGVIRTAAKNKNFTVVREWLPLVKDWGKLEGRIFKVSMTYESLLRYADDARECVLKKNIDRMFTKKTGYRPPEYIVYFPKCK